MKALQLSTYGGLDALSFADVPVPDIGDDEVLVRIRAAGVNPVDIAVSNGLLSTFMPLVLPATLGSEMAGVVERVGRNVSAFVPGDAVHGATGTSGSFAEFIVVKAASLTPKPRELDFAEAAGLPIAAGTATVVLDAINVGPGTRVVIHAASGGVGSVAVQLAKARGAYVIALASPANLDFVRGLGADEAVDRTTAYEAQVRNVDVVIDAFGPEAQARSWGMLKPGGFLASLVSQPDEEEANRRGVHALHVFGSVAPELLKAADSLVAEGKLKVAVNKVYRFDQALDALREVGAGQVRGKNVLLISQ